MFYIKLVCTVYEVVNIYCLALQTIQFHNRRHRQVAVKAASYLSLECSLLYKCLAKHGSNLHFPV